VLNLLLLGGKVLFLLVLYLFVYMVIRSAVRELRTASASRAGYGRVSALVESGAARPHAGEGGHADGHWALAVVESPALPSGRSLALAPTAALRLGRAPDNDLPLEDTFVSSHHARLSSTSDGLLLEDLGSTNGTYVNGEETNRAWLRPGDEISIGDTVFRVEVH
jgi:hypothetical protein